MYQRYSCMYKCTILTARALHAPQLIQFFLLSSRSCLYDQLLLRIPSILKKRKNILSPTESPVLLFSRSGNRGAPESKLGHPAAPSRNRTRKNIHTSHIRLTSSPWIQKSVDRTATKSCPALPRRALVFEGFAQERESGGPGTIGCCRQRKSHWSRVRSRVNT